MYAGLFGRQLTRHNKRTHRRVIVRDLAQCTFVQNIEPYIAHVAGY